VVDLDLHVLSQGHLQVFNLEGDGLCPGKGTTGPGVVGDANGEAAVFAVGRQQVLARALEVEHAAIEGPVVRVTEHGAHGVVFYALGAALAGFLNGVLAQGARTARLGRRLLLHLIELGWVAAR